MRKGCRNIRDQALVEFLSSSGCRLSEAAGIRAEQVDWKQRSVRVLGKGRKIRTVFFSFRAGQLLREYLSQREGGDALFAAVRAPWSPLTPGGIEKALARIGQRARGWNGGSTPISCGIPLLRRRCRVGCRCR